MSNFSPNSAQATYWTDVGGPHWVEHQRVFDHMLAHFGAEALRVLDVQPGEHILDIGCGTATTTMALADAVGPSGRVHGVDISPTMIDAARLRAAAYSNATFALADAQTDRLAAGNRPFDAAFSRFGVMFFEDPVTALANIAAGVRSGGRLVFACWRDEDLNPWLALPAEVMRRFTPEPVLPPPNSPGPFAFADGDRLETLIRDAGWSNADLTSFTAPAVLGAGLGVDEALAHSLSSRPGLTLREQVDDETFLRAAAAVREVLTQHVVDGAVVFNGTVWIARARKP